MGWVSWPLHISVFLPSFLKNPYLYCTRLQNRILYGIFLDEVGSDQSGGILSPFMGTACLFSCILAQNLVCDVYGLRSSFQSNSVYILLLYILHPYKDWRCKGWKIDWKNHVSNVKGTLGMYVLHVQPPEYLIINPNRFSYLGNQFIKRTDL